MPDVRRFLDELVAASRAEPGCVSYEVNFFPARNGDLGGWEFVQCFKDKEAQDAHKPNFAAFMDKVSPDYIRHFDPEQQKLLDTTKSGKPPIFESAPAKVEVDEKTGQVNIRKMCKWMVPAASFGMGVLILHLYCAMSMTHYLESIDY